MSNVVRIGNRDVEVDENGEVINEQQTLDEMAENTVIERALPGSEEQLSFELGSQYTLSTSTLKLAPVAPLRVEGQFQEGDRFSVVLEVEVEQIAFVPVRRSGFRVGTERRHVAYAIGVSPA